MSDIVERLRDWFTDWDGSRMVPGEPPRDGIHCDILMEAAAEIERLRERHRAKDEQYWSLTEQWANAEAEIERLRGRGVFGDDGVPRLVAVDDETFKLTMLDELRALREAVEGIKRKYANEDPG